MDVFVRLWPCWAQCTYISQSRPGQTVTTLIPSCLLFYLFFTEGSYKNMERGQTKKKKKTGRENQGEKVKILNPGVSSGLSMDLVSVMTPLTRVALWDCSETGF